MDLLPLAFYERRIFVPIGSYGFSLSLYLKNVQGKQDDKQKLCSCYISNLLLIDVLQCAIVLFKHSRKGVLGRLIVRRIIK